MTGPTHIPAYRSPTAATGVCCWPRRPNGIPQPEDFCPRRDGPIPDPAEPASSWSAPLYLSVDPAQRGWAVGRGQLLRRRWRSAAVMRALAVGVVVQSSG